MGKERLSAKKITIWICVNYGIFVLGFFILGSMGTDKFIVWSNFILDVFLVAVSLALNQKKRSVSDHKLVSQDLERIQTVAAYLSDHYAGEVPIERLAQIACMGTTKLKSSFKKVYGCTITEYIQQRRMSQAEYLLAHTDLQIGQIAQTIGYSTSSRFAELFRRSTGLLPLEYRKMAKRK